MPLFPVTEVTPLTMEFSSPTCTDCDEGVCEMEKLQMLYCLKMGRIKTSAQCASQNHHPRHCV
jgi:hypothetical protein